MSSPFEAHGTIGGYRIQGAIGAGGMGMVYLAQHELLGRVAALKVLLPELSHDQEVVGRFFGEAKAATAIKHPGIVKVYDFGHQDDGSAFIAMEYLEGEPLDARLARLGPMPVLQALRFAGQMASALAAAHGHGIVHRDLKPGNVFIVPDPQVPGGERIKLLDFGIAKFSSSDDPRSQHTRAGAIMGSPAYMSPEQCRGLPDVDARADLYSVGCMLLEMLTGKPPFDGGGQGALAIMSAQLQDPPPVPSSLRPEISGELDALILYLLAKDPAQRYQSAADLGYALAAVSGEQVSFSSLPGVTAEHPARTAPNIGLNPTGQPLHPSQIATLRNVTAPRLSTPPRARRGALWAALAAIVVVAGIVAAILLAGSPAKAPPVVAAPTVPKAPEPPAPLPPPRKPSFTFKARTDAAPRPKPSDETVAAVPSGTATVPIGESGLVPSLGSLGLFDQGRLSTFTFSFSGLFSGSLISNLFGALTRPAAPAPPPPRMVTWTLASVPPGATILDGDTVLGTTEAPLVATFEESPGYVATLVLRLDGYDDATVQLSGTEDADRTIELVPRIPVTVTSKPPGATILDASGAPLGVTPATVPLSRSTEAVPLTLRLEGYEDQALAVVPDKERTERATLTKVRATITIHLESTPAGAEVVKDGQVIGTTPFDDRFLELKEKVQYTLRLADHRDYNVRVAGDQDATKSVLLKPLSKPPAKPVAKRKCSKPKPAVGDGPVLVDIYERC